MEPVRRAPIVDSLEFATGLEYSPTSFVDFERIYNVLKTGKALREVTSARASYSKEIAVCCCGLAFAVACSGTIDGNQPDNTLLVGPEPRGRPRSAMGAVLVHRRAAAQWPAQGSVPVRERPRPPREAEAQRARARRLPRRVRPIRDRRPTVFAARTVRAGTRIAATPHPNPIP